MDNIYSAYHYACKTKADKEAIEQIYEEVKKSAQKAIYRNVGDIFFTARTDTEINGAVECNGGTYSTADFEGKQNVGYLLASGSLPYVTLSEYESLVSANGSCRAFGWDGGTEFRVPTIPALLLTKEQSAVVGNGMTLGLKSDYIDGSNGGFLANNSGLIYSNSTAYGQNAGTLNNASSTLNTYKTIGITTDPTKSGIVANLDVIEYRAMVQLASGATDQAVITATSALQQLANKANRDLSNVASVASNFKEQSVGWGIPDYTAGISIAVPKSSAPYTAPCSGIYIITYQGGKNTSGKVLQVNGGNAYQFQYTSAANPIFNGVVNLDKGDVLSSDTTSIPSEVHISIFYPFKGVK
jgi:hypothetical protein